mgnify:CR=1 FL=1
MLNRELANRARAAEAQKLLLAYEAARRHRRLPLRLVCVAGTADSLSPPFQNLNSAT